MPNHLLSPELHHRYHSNENGSSDLDQWVQHSQPKQHHQPTGMTRAASAAPSSMMTEEERLTTNTSNMMSNHLLMNEKFNSMSVMERMHRTASPHNPPTPSMMSSTTPGTRSSLGQLIERSTSAPPPILLQHPFATGASSVASNTGNDGGGGNTFYHRSSASPSLHTHNDHSTHRMSIPTTIITSEENLDNDLNYHQEEEDTAGMSTSHKLFESDIYDYVTKGYSEVSDNGMLSKPHNTNQCNYNMVDDDSGRATSQTTNSGSNTNNNNGSSNSGYSNHHFFTPSSTSHNAIGHAVTRPLSAASVTVTNTTAGSLNGFSANDSMLFDPLSHQANHNDDFLNHDFALKIQRSQSAAPSMNGGNIGRSSLTKLSTIGAPPGLLTPPQDQNIAESFVAFSSPFSSSPFAASTTATTSLSSVGGGIRRPASAGVVGGNSLYHFHQSQSGGAVRPAPKTLMELIQEESIPPRLSAADTTSAPTQTGTVNVDRTSNGAFSSSTTPSPPQTQSVFPSLSNSDINGNSIATTAPNNNNHEPLNVYTTPKTFESQTERQFLPPVVTGGDSMRTNTAVSIKSSPPHPPLSSLQRQVRNDQEQQQYQYRNSSDNISASMNSMDYVVAVSHSGNSNDVTNDIHRFTTPTATVQYAQPQQQPRHTVHASGNDPQQQPYASYNPNLYQSPVSNITTNNIYHQNMNEFVVDEGLEQQQVMMQAPIYVPQQQQQLVQNGQHMYYSNVQQQQQPLMQHQPNNRMQQAQQQQQIQHVSNVSMNNGPHQPQTIYVNANGQIQQQQGYGYTTVQMQQSHHLHELQQQPQMLQHHTAMSGGANQPQDQYVSVVPIQRGSSNTSVSYWQPNGMMQQQPPHHSQQQLLFPTSGLVTMGGQINNTMDSMYHVPGTNAMKGRDTKVPRGRRSSGGRGAGRDMKPDIPTTSAILDEFHSAKSRDWTIRRIEGHVVEFCQDQSGSRFIQQRLEMGDHTEQQIVMKEVLRAIRRLRNDVFGNYVIQKLLDFGTAKMKSEIRDTLEGEMLSLSLQMYGCRVVQKAIETVEEEDLPRLLREFHNDVLGCIHDQNGNHVIQKCIEVLNSRANKAETLRDLHRAAFLREQIDFILNDILTNAIALSCHPYGCRVLQRILEHCTEEKKVAILDEIKLCHKDLLDDQYGNYVVQHVLQYGRDVDRDSIVQIVVENGLLGLARQKFASNVVEKLLKYGNNDQRRAVVREMLKKADDPTVPSEPGDGNAVVVLLMVRDAYANYVVQTTLDVVPESEEKHLLLQELNSHIDELRNYTFAKHIVAKLTSLATSTLP